MPVWLQIVTFAFASLIACIVFAIKAANYYFKGGIIIMNINGVTVIENMTDLPTWFYLTCMIMLIFFILALISSIIWSLLMPKRGRKLRIVLSAAGIIIVSAFWVVEKMYDPLNIKVPIDEYIVCATSDADINEILERYKIVEYGDNLITIKGIKSRNNLQDALNVICIIAMVISIYQFIQNHRNDSKYEEPYDKVIKDLNEISSDDMDETAKWCLLYEQYANLVTRLDSEEENHYSLKNNSHTGIQSLYSDCKEIVQGVLADKIMNQNGYYKSDKNEESYWHHDKK